MNSIRAGRSTPEEERLRMALFANARLFEKLDEALASPERIAEDTKAVGGFCSGINILYTDEDVVERAIRVIQRARAAGIVEEG